MWVHRLTHGLSPSMHTHNALLGIRLCHSDLESTSVCYQVFPCPAELRQAAVTPQDPHADQCDRSTDNIRMRVLPECPRKCWMAARDMLFQKEDHTTHIHTSVCQLCLPRLAERVHGLALRVNELAPVVLWQVFRVDFPPGACAQHVQNRVALGLDNGLDSRLQCKMWGLLGSWHQATWHAAPNSISCTASIASTSGVAEHAKHSGLAVRRQQLLMHHAGTHPKAALSSNICTMSDAFCSSFLGTQPRSTQPPPTPPVHTCAAGSVMFRGVMPLLQLTCLLLACTKSIPAVHCVESLNMPLLHLKLRLMADLICSNAERHPTCTHLQSLMHLSRLFSPSCMVLLCLSGCNGSSTTAVCRVHWFNAKDI